MAENVQKLNHQLEMVTKQEKEAQMNIQNEERRIEEIEIDIKAGKAMIEKVEEALSEADRKKCGQKLQDLKAAIEFGKEEAKKLTPEELEELFA